MAEFEKTHANVSGQAALPCVALAGSGLSTTADAPVTAHSPSFAPHSQIIRGSWLNLCLGQSISLSSLSFH